MADYESLIEAGADPEDLAPEQNEPDAWEEAWEDIKEETIRSVNGNY